MLLVPHVLVRLFEFLKCENLLIYNGLDSVRIDSLIHGLELLPTPNENAPHNAYIAETLHKRRLVLRHTTKEADNADDTLRDDSCKALLHGSWATDLEDVMHAQAVRRELLRGGAPVWIRLIIYDMVGTKLLEDLRFGIGTSYCDHSSTGSFGELNTSISIYAPNKPGQD